VAVPELWAGTDAGKAEHHCVVIGTDGKRKLSRRVANDETALLKLIADVIALSEGERALTQGRVVNVFAGHASELQDS
jgi:hypothetical protein